MTNATTFLETMDLPVDVLSTPAAVGYAAAAWFVGLMIAGRVLFAETRRGQLAATLAAAVVGLGWGVIGGVIVASHPDAATLTGPAAVMFMIAVTGCMFTLAAAWIGAAQLVTRRTGDTYRMMGLPFDDDDFIDDDEHHGHDDKGMTKEAKR